MKFFKYLLNSVIFLVAVISSVFAIQFLFFPNHSFKQNLLERFQQLHTSVNRDTQPKEPPNGVVTKQKTSFLTCSFLKDRTKDFLKYHYSIKNFDKEISHRTFWMYFKLLDPGKLYFTNKDIRSFEKYEDQLAELINKGDCRFINEVYTVYKKRVKEQTDNINEILKKKFDFKADEKMEVDRKKVEWTKDNAELKERWRKNLKFYVLNSPYTENTDKKIEDRLKKRYSNFQKEVETKSQDEIYGTFLNAFALSLDPHSSYFMPADQEVFQVGFSLKLFGIGASLKNVDGYTTIDTIVPGGAAARDGRLKKDDKIIAVDPGDGSGVQDVIDMDLDKVVQLIRGKENTPVILDIMRKSSNGKIEKFQIKLFRAVVQLKEGEAKSDVMIINNRKVGVINLPSFYVDYQGCRENSKTCRSSANDMAREINKLKEQKVDAIVVDVRRNGGGDLSECAKIVGLFINDPVVVQTEDRDHQVRNLEESSKAIYTGPLAILVSKYTASASEILAGAVQDYGRGLILGTSRTFGKGTVQTIIDFPGKKDKESFGAIRVTIAKFFRPSGKSNQEKGVNSDIIIPDILEASEAGEAEIEYALPYTTIKPSIDFKADNTLNSILPKLQLIANERLSKSKEFQDVIKEIEKARKESLNTLVSLRKPLREKKDKPAKKTSDSSNKSDKKTSGTNDKSKDGQEEEEMTYEEFTKVIRKNDLQLKESSHLLLEAVSLLGGKKQWIK